MNAMAIIGDGTSAMWTIGAENLIMVDAAGIEIILKQSMNVNLNAIQSFCHTEGRRSIKSHKGSQFLWNRIKIEF